MMETLDFAVDDDILLTVGNNSQQIGRASV